MYQQTNLKKILTNGGVVIHLKILFRCSQLSLGPAKGVDHTILASLCHLLDPRGEGESAGGMLGVRLFEAAGEQEGIT